MCVRVCVDVSVCACVCTCMCVCACVCMRVCARGWEGPHSMEVIVIATKKIHGFINVWIHRSMES